MLGHFVDGLRLVRRAHVRGDLLGSEGFTGIGLQMADQLGLQVQHAGVALEKIRREELRNLDAYKAISLLCGPADYTIAPRAPKPTSGLVEQQFWFMKARKG